jgi:predicted dehydrogenase
MSAELSFAVIGAGRLGTFHARNLHTLNPQEPRFIVDSNAASALTLATEVSAEVGGDLGEVLRQVEAVIIATPTESHFQIACAAFEAGCHVLIEKPMTSTTEQAEQLVALAEAKGKLLQVGHVERFNPVFRAAKDQIGVPAFVETHRLAPFVPRSIDVDVVLDLMIHDLDLLLCMVPYPIESLDAVGVAVLTDREDIANARVRFVNGTVANLTASRVSSKRERKVRCFGSSGYHSLDFNTSTGKRALIDPSSPTAIEIPGIGRVGVREESFTVPESNAISDEISAFIDSIQNGTPSVVSGQEALKVLKVASQIQQKVRESLAQLAKGGHKAGQCAGTES